MTGKMVRKAIVAVVLFVFIGTMLFCLINSRKTKQQIMNGVDFIIYDTLNKEVLDTLVKGDRYFFVFTTRFSAQGRSFWPGPAEIETDSLVRIELTLNEKKFLYELSRPEKAIEFGGYELDNTTFDSFSDFVKYYNYSSFSGEVDVHDWELGTGGIVFRFMIPEFIQDGERVNLELSFYFKSGKSIKKRKIYTLI